MNPRNLEEIDRIVGKKHLPSTLLNLAEKALFADPVHGQKVATVGEYQQASVQQKRLMDLRRCVYIHNVAYLASIAIQRSNIHRSAQLTERDFVTAINLYNDFLPPLDEQTLSHFLVRTAYQQFPYQVPWYSYLRRARYIYSHRGELNGLCMAKTVEDTIGVTYEELMKICITIYLHAVHTKGAPITVEDLMQYKMPWMTLDNVQHTLAAISLTQDQFRVSAEQTKSGDPALRIYDFNPLLSRPAIRLGNSYYLPVPPLLPMWLTNGIAYQLSEVYGNGDFFNLFGRAFEGYVAQSLRAAGRQYTPEKTIETRNGEVKTADYMIREDDRALVFDCKTRRFALKGRYGIQDAIENEVKTTVVKGLTQGIRTAKFINSGVPELADLHGVKDFVFAVVTLEDFYWANNPWFKEMVRSKLGADENFKYHVLSAWELDIILANTPTECTLAELFNEKSNDKDKATWGFKEFLYDRLRQNSDTIHDPSKDEAFSIMLEIGRYLTR